MKPPNAVMSAAAAAAKPSVGRVNRRRADRSRDAIPDFVPRTQNSFVATASSKAHAPQ
jgi:hypothetical protein